MMVTVPIKGIIVPNNLGDIYSFLGYEVASPNQLNEALSNANGQDITLEINSPGGYIDAGSEMYTALKKYPGNVTAQVVGQACSAASWIALAADKVEMSPTAQMMIHRVSVGVEGNVDDLTSALQSLDSMDQTYVDLYSKRTGLDKQEVYRMMCETTWMNAKQAVDKGFADSIMFENDQTPAVVNAYGVPVLSNSAIRKIKELIHEKSDDDSKPIENSKENAGKGQAEKDLSLLLWQ